ncbi:MAG: cytochrome c peroxidase [Acidobacteriia bacterium]|nr:cytochrome c peroxidase [Terriglobia bacterium]
MPKRVLICVAALMIACCWGVLEYRGDNQTLASPPQHSMDISKTKIDPATLKVFAPLPEVMSSEKNSITQAKVDLGRMLYYDQRLSLENDISCNSCHQLDKFGVDQKAFSSGHRGKLGSRNSPSVYNAAAHFAQFWDGRAPDVEEQAKGPVLNPVEMAMPNGEAVVSRLKAIPGYVEAFRRAFPGEADPVTFNNMGKAIGAFERGLVTPSRWDDFLKGNDAALLNVEKIGFNKFVATGCAMCHSGVLLGGMAYMKMGVAKPWSDVSDEGRFAVTHNAADKMKFKVPSLRNVEMTGPYFHRGTATTLEEAVKSMAEYELGTTPSRDDVLFMVAWLKSLTGKIPGEYIRMPELPKAESVKAPAEE